MNPSATSSTVNEGVYADLSNYPRAVSYYAKCPVCGGVHGSFKTMREAHSQKVCGACSLDDIDKIKKQVHQVVWEPEKKVKPLAKLVGESDESPDAYAKFQPDGNEENASKADEIPVDPVPVEGGPGTLDQAHELLTHYDSWVREAIAQLCEEIGKQEEDADIEDGKGDYHYRCEDSTTYFKVTVGGYEYEVFKNEDVTYNQAVRRVEFDVTDTPELFKPDFLARFVDEDKLKSAIGDPYEDWGDDITSLDYEDKIEKLVDNDRIEFDDERFFTSTGKLRKLTKSRASIVDELIEKFIEDTKPEFDPWVYLRDVYGEEEVAKRAVELAGINAKEAAEACVSSDGWESYLDRDDRAIHLPNGAVAIPQD